jgi:predicted ATPase
MELYLDNFRGFEKQYIELNDVNFLVGENSTGKTTLLGLLSLFSDFREAWYVDFKNEYVDFGPFADVVSKIQRLRKEFIIGFRNEDNDVFPPGEITLSYSDNNAFPFLKRITCRVEDLIAVFSNNGKKNDLLTCKFYKISGQNPNWADAHLSSENHFLFETTVDIPFDFGLEPIFDLLEYRNKQEGDLINKFASITYNKFHRDENVFWIDPVRSKPKRIYEPQKLKYSPEGEHTPTLLRDILTNNTAKQNKNFLAALEGFGKASGLFDEIKIDQYRKSKDSPFSLLFKLKNKELKISNIGYGISQVLPILTEILYAPKESTFLIQQPEVHLHPRSQAYFGEFVYNQLVAQKKKFVIETHSDYLIDRFRLQVRKRNGQVHKKTNVLFFETDGQTNKVTKIAIDKNGDYVGEQPQKFREFFLKEEMELLGL